MKPLGHVLLIVMFAIFVGLVLLPAAVRASVREKRRGSELDVEAMLFAIRSVETRSPDEIGRAGERSAYQFTRATWAVYTSAPFERASTDPKLADCVARTHLAFVRRQLALRGYPDRPDYIAAAWRFGPWFARWRVLDDYPRRAAALYAEAARP